MTDLSTKTCGPCRGGAPAATVDEIEQLHAGVSGWEIVEIDGVNRLRRTFEFSSYRETIDFVNKVADLAEEQGHHPDMLVEYGRATVS